VFSAKSDSMGSGQSTPQAATPSSSLLGQPVQRSVILASFQLASQCRLDKAAAWGCKTCYECSYVQERLDANSNNGK